MTLPPAAHSATTRNERLANWLALLAFLALGILAPCAPAPSTAHSLAAAHAPGAGTRPAPPAARPG